MPYDEEIPPHADFPEPPPDLDRLGLPEDAYEGALCIELTSRGVAYGTPETRGNLLQRYFRRSRPNRSVGREKINRGDQILRIIGANPSFSSFDVYADH